MKVKKRRPIKAGDKVTITCNAVTVTCNEHTVDGVVLLASSNEASLLLGFDAILCGHVGTMPVLRDADGSYYSLLGRFPVTVTRKGNDDG